jgi:hypothetical protein
MFFCSLIFDMNSLSNKSHRTDAVMFFLILLLVCLLFFGNSEVSWFGYFIFIAWLLQKGFSFYFTCFEISIDGELVYFKYKFAKFRDFSVRLKEVKAWKIHHGLSSFFGRMLSLARNVIVIEAAIKSYQIPFSIGKAELSRLVEFLNSNGIQVEHSRSFLKSVSKVP